MGTGGTLPTLKFAKPLSRCVDKVRVAEAAEHTHLLKEKNAMKKLRLTSFVLAFVMVVTLMVPMMSIFTFAADAPSTLPSGATLPAWSIGWPNGSVNAKNESLADAIGNPNVNADWAGQTYTEVALTGGAQAATDDATTAKKFNTTYAYSINSLDVAKFAGVMVDVANTSADHNNGIVITLIVDGVTYYAMSMTDLAVIYMAGYSDADWRMISNYNFAFSGHTAENSERAIRLPKAYDGRLFAPVESFHTVYANTAPAGYNGTLSYSEQVLTDDVLANAKSVALHVSTTWGKTTTVGGAALVYQTNAAAAEDTLPAGAPATLPTMATTEWTKNAGYGAAKNANFPIGLTLDGMLVGQKYTLSDNLLKDAVKPSTGAYADATLAAAVKANANVAGIMLKLSVAGNYNPASEWNNNGIGIQFKSNGKVYSVSSMDGNTVYDAHQIYIYDENTIGDWLYTRDCGGQAKDINQGIGGAKATRVPDGFKGYVFVPLDEIRLSKDSYKAVSPNVVVGLTNAAADLIAGGISDMAFGAFWGQAITVESANYVYVEGYDSQAKTLPGSIVTFVDQLNYRNGTTFQVCESAGNEKNTAIRFDQFGATYTTTPIANAVSTDTAAGGFSKQMSLVVSSSDNVNAALATADGFMLHLTVGDVNSGNNAFLVALVVDGVQYFSQTPLQRAGQNEDSVEYNGHMNYFQWDNSSKWFATDGRHFKQGGAVQYNYDRAMRVPHLFSGNVYIPVEHFVKSYTLESVGSSTGDNSRLTHAALAAAKDVKLYVGQIWNQNQITFDSASIVNVTSSMQAPTSIPAKENVVYYSSMRWDSMANPGTLWNKSIDASLAWQGANAMPDYLWGKEFTTTTVSTTKTVETGLTVNDLSAALAGKDITDLAGVLVEVEALNSAKWNAGYGIKIVAADGLTYESGKLGNGNNHSFLYGGANGWVEEAFNGSCRIPLGYSGYGFIPVSTFAAGVSGGGAANKPASALFLSEQLNGLASMTKGNALTSLTFTQAWGSGVTVKSISLVWVDGLGEAMEELRMPTNLPVNAQTYLYENGKEYTIANNGTANADGFYGNWKPFTALGTVANPVSDYVAAETDPDTGDVITPASGVDRTVHTKDLRADFEGKAIVATSLISNAEILKQGISKSTCSCGTKGCTKGGLKTYPIANGGVGYTAPSVTDADKVVHNSRLDFVVDASKQAVSATAAGLLLRVDTNKNAANCQGTGIDVGVTLGDGSYYSMFSAGRGKWPASNKTAYLYDYMSGTWMAQMDMSKLRLISGFDGYVFIPFTTLGTTANDAEVMMDMNDVLKYGIAQVHVDGYWNHDLAVKSIELASAEVVAEDYIISAAPMLGDDITLKFDNSGFNPYNLDASFSITVNGGESIDLIESNGAFYYTGIKAQNMTDKIDITLKLAGETVRVYNDYSIKQYAINTLAATGTTEAQKTLINAMLQYGAAAQIAAGYNTNDLPTTFGDEEIAALATPTTTVAPSGDKVTVSATLRNDIAVTVSGVDGEVTASLTDAQGNTRVVAVQTPVNGTIVLTGIGANELNGVITLTVGNTVVKTFCVNNYLAAVAANENNTAAFRNLAKALYAYGVAAAAYAPVSYATSL